MPKLVLIDGYSLLYRAFYALPTLTTSRGEYANAVYGFALMLLRLLEDEAPERVAVAFDREGPTLREEQYSAYKANRPSMPDPLRSQIPLVRDLVKAFGIPSFDSLGFEADDCIGTLARSGAAHGHHVLIVTGDRDALQLVSENITALITRTGIKEMDRFDPDAVFQKFGVPPERIIDLKGLMGDTSDNIPGVPGVGPKTAQTLLQKYGTVENILEHREELTPKMVDLFCTYGEQALLSKSLATICDSVPLEIPWETWPELATPWADVADFFARMEFKALTNRVLAAHPEVKKAIAVDSVTSERKEQGALFGAQTLPAPIVIPWDAPELSRHLESLDPTNGLVVHVVPDSGDPMLSSLWGIGLSDGKRSLAVRPADGSTDVPADLSRLLADCDVPKWCHDAKPQMILLNRIGCELGGLKTDTMVASYLVNPGQGGYRLEDLSLRVLGQHLPPLEQLQAGKKRGVKTLSDLDEQTAEERLAAEVGLIQRLRAPLEDAVADAELSQLYRDVELPLVAVLAGMERTGIKVDVALLAEMSKEMESKEAALAKQIYEMAGESFNLNSPKQLGHILFEKLKLHGSKKTKTGLSTSAEVLDGLAEEHEIVAKILEYRQVTKLKGTYVDALPQLVNPATGRVHTTFNQGGAVTGRLSSTNPGLQNIPVRTEEGVRIREAFVPGEPGWLLVSADYSQIELRILAHLANDSQMIAAFRSGEDIHARTAAEIFGVAIDSVTGDMRSSAKAINFGIVYGISSFGLARGTGLSRNEAQAYIDGYFARYPNVKAYMDDSINRAREMGYVTTLFRRRRYLPDIHSKQYVQRSFAERTAINSPVQGTAADIIKMAMVAVDRRLKEDCLKSRMLLQVHDELVFEAPLDELERLFDLVKGTMEQVVELEVPLRVDVKAGRNWREAKGA